MYTSFTKYYSTVPGVLYQGLQGMTNIQNNNNLNPHTGQPYVPNEYYDYVLFDNMLQAMLEFKSKPNGIIFYTARGNDVDTVYTITSFNNLEDFISIATTNWFEDYSAKRNNFLNHLKIQTFQKNLDYMLPVTEEASFDDLDRLWKESEVIIA